MHTKEILNAKEVANITQLVEANLTVKLKS